MELQYLFNAKRKRRRTVRETLLVLSGVMAVVIICFGVVSYGADNEYRVHHNITVNLNGGSCDTIYYKSIIDNGDRAGEENNDLRIGDYLPDYFGTYHYIADYNAPQVVADKTISAYYDCVGVTPYVRIGAVHRDGYTFAGWSVTGDWGKHDDYAENGITVNIGAFTDEDIVITANWTRNSYTLDVNTYYLSENGSWIFEGSGFSKATVNIDINGNRIASSARDYYGSITGDSVYNIGVNCSEGWVVDYSKTPSLNGNITSNRTVNIYLCPKQLVARYHSGFAGTYGIGVSGMPSQEIMYYGYAKKLSGVGVVPKAANGLIFKGWAKSPSEASSFLSSGNLFVEKRDLNIYAIWNYRIRFNKNVADKDLPYVKGDMDEAVLQLGVKGTIKACDLNRTGYEFVGWNTKADGSGTTVANGAKDVLLIPDSSGYANLYAIWKPISYTVKLCPDSPKKASANAVSLNKNVVKGFSLSEDGCYYKKVYYDETFELPEVTDCFKLLGWSKDGWQLTKGDDTSFKDGESVSNLTDKRDDLIVLISKWKENSYTIEFDSNGGLKIDDNIITNYEDEVTISKNPIRPGYSFDSWNTKADGSGAGYDNDSVIDKLVDENGGKVILFAQWKQKEPVCLRAASNSYKSTLVNDNSKLITPDWFNNIGSRSYKDYLNKNNNDYDQIWQVTKNHYSRLK